MKKGIQFYQNIFNSKRINGDIWKSAADPFIFKHNGYYYLICTKEKGLVLFKSKNLIYWEYVNENNGIVAEDEYLKYAFAPEMMYDNGYFYIVSSPSGNGHRIYRFPTITGPYEKYSDNIQELIDGSYFKDSSEYNYFLRASESGITLKRIKETNDVTDFDLFDEYYNFANTSIGNWTEGPYLLKRYGYYYLTFTGTHFLSNVYRVDYASGKDIKPNSFQYQNTLLITPNEKFYGLGHSMTFLGPNLDSYYIAYHNMMPNKERYLNISRLVFDNHGHMLVNGVDQKHNILWERPYFEKYISSNDYISEEVFANKSFTIEYNFKGKDVKLLIAYQNDAHYQYLAMKENLFQIIEKNDDNESILMQYPLRKKYNLDVFHSIRLQYKNKYLTLYLDDMELIYRKLITISQGRIGFINNELENSYLAYSLYAYGDSDKSLVKKDCFFLNNSIKNKDGYYLDFYIDKEADYDIYLTSLSTKKTNISLVLDKEIINSEYHKGNNYLGHKRLKKGYHHLLIKGIYPSTEILTIREDEHPTDITFDNFLNNVDIYHRYLKINPGLYLENDRNALLTKKKYHLYDVRVELSLVGLPTDEDRFVGLICDVNNYGKTNEFENAYSLKGWMYVINSKEIKIIAGDYAHSKIVYRMKKGKKNDYILQVIKDNQYISFYLDGQLIYQTDDNYRYLSGKIGIYNNHASGIFKNIEIVNLKEED